MTSSLLRRLESADHRAAAHLRRRAGLTGPRRAAGRRTGGSGADDLRSADSGFALLETVIAISLIVLVMAAFSVFFINTVAFTSLQRATQAATTLANSQLEKVRALPVSDLVTGRDVAGVTAQLAAAPVAVSAALGGMGIGVGAAVDTLARVGAGATANLPTAPLTQTLNGVLFSTNVYVGNCALPGGLALNATCAASTVSTGYLRVVVAVTWTGSRCPTTGCAYTTSTLLNSALDPKFAPSQTPPPLPVLTAPGPQTPAVGDVVALPLAVSAVGTYRVNVTAGTLPAGLVLDTATARISGSPVTVAGATPVTFTLTDGFDRTTSVTVVWTVIAALAATAPAAQASVIGTAVGPLTVRATGGTAPYTWTDATNTLPPGLTLASVSDTAVISGVPTTFGTFPVTLQVTDALGRTGTAAFTWNVDYPPFAATNPGPQTATVNTPDTVQLAVTGGSGSFVWSGGATLPAGLTLTPAGLISGNPTTVGTRSVVLVATDTATGIARPVTFTFRVFDRPTVTAPGAQQSTVGAAVSLQVGANCPNSPCSFVLNNGPATLGISATGLITGTITSSAQTFPAVTFTMTDSAGAAVISSGFAWVIVGGAPSAPQNVAVVNGDSALAVSWAPPATGSAVTRYTVSLSPGGATCTTTGALTCTITGLTNGAVYSATVTATTASGVGPASGGVQGIPYPAVMSAANGLTLWLDASDPAVFTTASGCTGAAATSTIGCWRDKSGAGLNFAQSTPANQPVVSTWPGNPNGLSVANFPDANDVLTSVAGNGVFQTVFTAVNLTNSGNSGRWVNVFGQAGTDVNVRLGTNGERAAPNANDWAFNTSTPGSGGPLNWINSVQGVKGTPPGAMITTDQSASTKSFTASVSNTAFSDRALLGQVGDIITFNRVLNAGERRSVEDYLSRKWGVVIVPQAPTSVRAERTTTNNGQNNGAVAVTWTPPALDGGTAPTYTVTAPGVTPCTTTGTTCTFTGLARTTPYTFTVTASNAAGSGPAVVSNQVTT